jgi:enediyne biosynthesis protein E4
MQLRQRARPALVVVTALSVCATVGLLTRLPTASAADRSALAGRFSFQIGYANGDPAYGHTVREVQPALRHIRTWISAVGASAGLADFDGDGMANEYCLVDPRDDMVTVAATPNRAERFHPIGLMPRDVAYRTRSTAPMGCVPADLNEDGYTDVLVYFWGRTPLAYLRNPGMPLGVDAFVTVDLVADPTRIWNSTTANVVDLDGDGHLDVFIGNYFPDGARVLDPDAIDDPLMRMQDSMSKAANGGRNAILRLDGVTTVGGVRRPHYVDASAALTETQAKSWTLATGAQDLDGDGLPELYVANDFGPDYLLFNRSKPGEIRFTELRGERGATTPKSKVLGNDSFKSMGVTFTDLNHDARPDIVVSNITTPFALEESNFAFVSTGTGPLTGGVAPYRDDSEPLGLSRTGWAWDVKAADFDGDGTDELVQALGFLAGDTNRWPELQELAMTNDDVVRFPWAWPDFLPGDDIAGHQRNPFFVRQRSGRYVDIAADLGIENPGPSRGLAVGDVDHDGKLDLLVANQWARSTFLYNTGPARTYLGLRLLLPAVGTDARPRPAVGASVTVTRPDGTALTGQLFPANGHTGVNAAELLFGLGPAGTGSLTGPLTVKVSWRDGAGMHATTTTLAPGWHTLTLDAGSATR